MRTMLVVLMALCLISSFAVAKPDLEKPLHPYDSNSRATEVEPNDDYTTANTLTAGDDMNGAMDVGGDVDFFAITVGAGDAYAFQTHPGDIGDTKLYLFDTDGTTQLAYNDDGGGQGYYSLIEYVFAAAGTYFVEVTGYTSSYTGTYILTATVEEPPPPPPANDVCEGAIDLQEQDLSQFDVDLADGGYTNVSAMGSGGCTGYSTNSPDAFYKIYLTAGETFTATEDGSCDMAFYLFTDCADPFASCVAGSDLCCSGTQEIITYVAEADGWYYVGVDAYTSAGCLVTVTIDAPVSNNDSSWGAVKGLYR